MALINCPECSKEVSDKAAACIHCGNPMKETQQRQAEQEQIGNTNAEYSVGTGIATEPKKSKKKILAPAVIGACVIVAVIVVYAFVSIIPNGKYNEAMTLLERGKYNEAYALLNQFGNFKNAEEIINQIRYESIAYNCINELKKILKVPDSVIPYSIDFYLGQEEEEDAKPSVVMYYGAQNGFGGTTTGYVFFTYSEEKTS